MEIEIGRDDYYYEEDDEKVIKNDSKTSEDDGFGTRESNQQSIRGLLVKRLPIHPFDDTRRRLSGDVGTNGLINSFGSSYQNDEIIGGHIIRPGVVGLANGEANFNQYSLGERGIFGQQQEQYPVGLGDDSQYLDNGVALVNPEPGGLLVNPNSGGFAHGGDLQRGAALDNPDYGGIVQDDGSVSLAKQRSNGGIASRRNLQHGPILGIADGVVLANPVPGGIANQGRGVLLGNPTNVIQSNVIPSGANLQLANRQPVHVIKPVGANGLVHVNANARINQEGLLDYNLAYGGGIQLDTNGGIDFGAFDASKNVVVGAGGEKYVRDPDSGSLVPVDLSRRRRRGIWCKLALMYIEGFC